MKLIKQIIRFGIVGLVATIIDFLLLFCLTDFLNIYYLVSSIISFIISLLVNYILSIKWVFDVKKKQTYREVLLFIILSTIGLLINQLILYIFTDIFNIYYIFSKLVATLIVMIYNFVTRKIFIEK